MSESESRSLMVKSEVGQTEPLPPTEVEEPKPETTGTEKNEVTTAAVEPEVKAEDTKSIPTDTMTSTAPTAVTPTTTTAAATNLHHSPGTTTTRIAFLPQLMACVNFGNILISNFFPWRRCRLQIFV